MAGAEFAGVEILGIAALGAAERDGQRILIGRDDDEVYVVSHQGKSQDEDVFGGGVDAELFEVDAAVAVAVEDALAARTALGDVVGFAGEDPPGASRHETILLS